MKKICRNCVCFIYTSKNSGRCPISSKANLIKMDISTCSNFYKKDDSNK